MKTRHIINRNRESFEIDINTFIKGKNIISIQYCTATTPNQIYYSALILYTK